MSADRDELARAALGLAQMAEDSGLDREAAVMGLFTAAVGLACAVRAPSGVAQFIEELAADLRGLEALKAGAH